MHALLLFLALTLPAQGHYPTCRSYDEGGQSCLVEFHNRPERGLCEVCREGKSCFMALDYGTDRELCEAYIEGKSCFMATSNPRDRGWCEVIRDHKACSSALRGVDRERCEERRYPLSHLFWRQ